MLQTKQEMRDNSVELQETEESITRKRLDLHQQNMGNYLMQTSTASMVSNHASIPPNFWMLANSNQHQVMNGDPIWTFPNVNNSGATVYRGTVSSGLHFMNFPTPVAVVPGQQLGSGSGGGYGEGQLNMFGGLNNSYRPIFGPGSCDSPASGSQSHHRGDGGGDDRHDTSSHNS